MLKRRMHRSLLLLVALVAAAAAVRPRIGRSAEKSGIPSAVFWQDKIRAEGPFDVVIAGDSRAYRGVAPGPVKEALGGATVLNFGFPSAGFEKKYLDRVEALSADGGIIVLALSTHALTPAAATDNAFLRRSRSFGKTQAPRWWLALGERFERIPLHKIAMAFEGSKRRYLERFEADGWVHSDTDPRNPEHAVAAYRRQLLHNKVDPALVTGLVQRVQRWATSGRRVVAFRIPTGDSIRNVEAELGGFEFDSLPPRLTAAGAEWLPSISENRFTSYDGSHLTGDAATALSQELGGALARKTKP